MQKAKLARNFLIIILLIGSVLVGWVIGNTIRQSIRERQYALEGLSAEDFGGFQEYALPLGGVLIENWSVFAWEVCKDDIYYTSLPAKCQTIGGRLIEVGNNEATPILLPWLETPEK